MDRYDFPNEPAQNQTRKPIRVSLGVLIISILLTGIIIFSATYYWLTGYYGRFTEFKKLNEVAELYEQNYFYDVDRELLSEALVQAYLYGSGDLFAGYYTAEEWEAQQVSASGNSVGIGVYVAGSEGGALRIAMVMDNSPAKQAGLLPGDIITAVDGKSTAQITYLQALELVQGEEGSSILLEILRGEETLELTIVRSKYVPQTVYAETVLQGGELYGYVRIMEFLSIETTYFQFRNAVASLLGAGVQGLIFDLRDNSGGDLNAILYILDYLLPEGPIVHIFHEGEKEPVTYTSDANEIDIPMVVLANENTASAAELFTCALRDYGKAEIVGKKTFGKGCGQSGKPLSDGSMVFITTFLYNPPYSESYDGIGIIPDYDVELAEEWRNENLFFVPHEEDAQLIKAIERITAAAAEAKSR